MITGDSPLLTYKVTEPRVKVNHFYSKRGGIFLPSQKHKMQYLLDDEYFAKFNILMKRLKRKSQSDLSNYVIERFIDDYEEIHGEIKIED